MPDGKVSVRATYTYWQDPKDGMWIGYWNDYPDYLTEGYTIDNLKYMLRDLRAGIDDMVSAGEIPSAVQCKTDTMEIP